MAGSGTGARIHKMNLKFLEVIPEKYGNIHIDIHTQRCQSDTGVNLRSPCPTIWE